MKPCPHCGTVGTVTVKPVLVARRVGTYSIAGAAPKAVAHTRWLLGCTNCDLHVVGRLEEATVDDNDVFTGGHFIEDQT